MNRFMKILLSVILILGMVITPLGGIDTTYASESEKNPMRAVWLRPKEISKEQVEATVQKLHDTGINTIFLESFYDGYTIFPVEYDYTEQSRIYGGFDVLEAYVEACHSRGMQLHAWVESFFIGMQKKFSGGPVYKALKNSENSDWLLTDREGNIGEDTAQYGVQYFLNPARDDCREWVVGLFEIIVKEYDIDGIQLDYVRYPDNSTGKEWGYDDYTVNAFKEYLEEQGKEVFDPRDVKPKSFEAGMFDHFKRLKITEYVKTCSERFRALKPDILISLSVYPFYNAGITNFMQSTQEWMEAGYGDFVAAMAYYENQIPSIAANTIAVAGGKVKNAVIGISAINNFTLESVANQTQQVFDSGAGIVYFEYEEFYNKGYAANLEGTLLKDTQFNIDVDAYRTDVVRADDAEKDTDLPITDIVLYVVLGVAVLVIIGAGVFLILNSRKKKSNLE